MGAGREALVLVAEIDVVRKGVDVPADWAAVIRITPPGHHDLIGVLERQWAQQDGIDGEEVTGEQSLPLGYG